MLYQRSLFIRLLVLTMLITFDPMGLVSAAGHFSKQAFLKVSGYFYGTEHRDDILVILISDEDVPFVDNPIRQTWPPSFGAHVSLLELIMDYRPKAVFYDVAFNDARDPEKERLTKLVSFLENQANGNGPPLVLGDINPVTDIDGGCDPTKVYRRMAPVLPEIKESGVDFALINWTSDSGNYPLFAPDEQCDFAPTVATKLVMLQQDRNGSWLQEPIAESPTDQPRPMELIWGANNPESNEDADYCETDLNTTAGLARSLWQLFWNSFFLFGTPQSDWEVPRPCIFHPWRTLKAGIIGPHFEDPLSLLEAIEGKTVFIGTWFEDSGDYITSPLHGKIPGVFLHAMAYDNLMTYGQDYMRPMSAGLVLATELFIAVLVTVTASALHLRLASRPFSHMKRIGAGFVALSLYAAFVFVLCKFFVEVLHVLPINWAAMLTAGTYLLMVDSTKSKDNP